MVQVLRWLHGLGTGAVAKALRRLWLSVRVRLGRLTAFDDVVKSLPCSVTAFFQDFDTLGGYLSPEKTPGLCRAKFLLSYSINFCGCIICCEGIDV